MLGRKRAAEVVAVGAGVGLDTGDLGGLNGAGGGRTGEASAPVPLRPVRRVRLRAEISWRRATFSDWEEPSSERMAEMSASRSEMSASSVDMYSIRGGVSRW